MIGGAVPCIWLEAITSSQRECVCHAVLCKQGLPSQQKGAGNKMKKMQCVARVAAWRGRVQVESQVSHPHTTVTHSLIVIRCWTPDPHSDPIGTVASPILQVRQLSTET